ncbi:uncharacterized protein PHACADRAFT_182971 [Phanerochaete carnosa HHB-10118-sp]|uniref:Uncharacterized protein n=1 Tax=Phanerochaete carnosa (strain HHB-10118-sp) TaxID=650164 RepID=K5WHB9_PHACS|nr:uncharacterized protein PHACADRAFT_182971 [Phanerochaete carnosa HHB-10118-sp]EKM58725.1 hypothetical protein PHACADRAFT_182971 [Phanerochaete carnosa HHB-10118-sp]
MSNPPAWSVYAEQLVGRGYGLPLWHPEPTLEQGEIKVGDVGFVSEGQFIRLFNAMNSEEDPINAGGVPKGFAVLKPHRRHFFSAPTHVSPGPICTTTTTFQKAKADIPGPTRDTGVTRLPRIYCEASLLLGYPVPPEAIILVSSWLKTTEWAVAAVSNYGKAHEFSFSACAGSYASAGFEVSKGTDVQMSVEQRSGPVFDNGRTLTAPNRPQYPSVLWMLGVRRKVGVTADAKDVIRPGDELLPSRQPPSPSGGGSSQGPSSRLWGFFGGSRSDTSPNDFGGSRPGEPGKPTHDISSVPEMALQNSRHSAIGGYNTEGAYTIEEPSTASRTSQCPDATAAVACHDDFYTVFPVSCPCLNANLICLTHAPQPETHPDGVQNAALRETLTQYLDVHLDKANVAFVGSDSNPYAAFSEDDSDKDDVDDSNITSAIYANAAPEVVPAVQILVSLSVVEDSDWS